MSHQHDPALPIVAYYDEHLAKFGDTAAGAAWPNERDRQLRFGVMCDLFRDVGLERHPPVVCDLGCGTGELLRYLRERKHSSFRYIGADRSALALSYARSKFPDARWVEIDVLTASEEQLEQLSCDYLIANGLFTVKHELTWDQMWSFMTETLKRIWPYVRRGIAFNVMSKAVDWEREDLFHVSYDDVARFLHGLAGRSIQLRADYGLYEFTAYASKPAANLSPRRPMIGVIPAFRPQLPPTEALIPYLRAIDEGRRYSNQGPLVGALQGRLTDAFGLDHGAVAVASTGTAALVGGIIATAGRAKPEKNIAICPAYTFVGTLSAIEHCGYTPHLVDVDAASWLLEARSIEQHSLLSRTGLIVPVSTYGRPVDIASWSAFKHRTGIPVVIDGAAAFEALVDDGARYCGDIPVAVSFHATKVFGCGEGGCLVTTDFSLTLEAVRALNFGFLGNRECLTANTNGKMSEYHAAVALAELDGWQTKRLQFQAVTHAYREAFMSLGLGDSLITAPSIASNYVLFHAKHPQEAETVRQALERVKIESRLWYGLGVHRHPYYRSVSMDSLPVSDRIAPCLLGLPVASDMAEPDIRRIATIIGAAIGPSTP
jgi:dTDP-4-amino-4,6-dideoxygalactose transaminase